MKSRNMTLVLATITAALYVVFTVALAPVSYGPIQFRVSEMLKALCLIHPAFAFGIGLGTFVSNFFSPYVGPWELIWMPLTDFLGGLLIYVLAKVLGAPARTLPSLFLMLVYSITTAAAVALMLSFVLGNTELSFLALTFFSVLGSEVIVLCGGYLLLKVPMKVIQERYGY